MSVGGSVMHVRAAAGLARQGKLKGSKVSYG